MARSTYKSLLEDLRHNDATSFRQVLEVRGLPRENFYDYDLLMRALRMNRKRIVNLLLNKKCRVVKPDELSPQGTTTPLHLVAEKLGWCDVIEKMLKLGARVTDVNADGNTALHLAFINQLSDRAVFLLMKNYVEESHEDIRNNDGLGFMHIACTRSDVESVQKFFDEGFCDIHAQVSMLCDSAYAGYSPLHFAVMAGKPEIVQFLCCYDADVYAQDRFGSTPIHLALEKRDIRSIDILLHYDSVNENYINDFGVSHFMAACAGSDQEVVNQFIEVARNDNRRPLQSLVNGRVKNVPDTQFAGYSFLHFAAEFNQYSTIEWFLKMGLPDECLIATTVLNLTPYEVAANQQNAETCWLFEQYVQFKQQQYQQQQLQVNCAPEHAMVHMQHHQVACN